MSENLYLAKNKNPKFFYGYVVVLASFIIMVLMFGTLYTFGIFFNPLLAEFGWTRAITSGAFALSFLLQGLLGMGMGRLTDRFGPRMVIVISGLFLGSGYLLMSQIGAIWQLYLFYGVIVGIGMSGTYVALMATVPRWFVKRRGMMSGIVMAGIGAGTMIMSPAANWLISKYEWRISYIIIGSIALVLIILAAQFLRRDPGQKGQLPYGADEVKTENTGLKLGEASFQEAMRNRQFWIVCVMFFCFGFSLYIVLVHVVPHAIELGISTASAASILAIIGGLSIAGKIIMGSTVDRIGSRGVMIIGFILISVALLWLLVATEIWMLYLFAAIFAFGYGGCAAAQSPMVAEMFGLRSVGAILGFASFSFTVGGAIGPFLAGWLFDMSGRYAVSFLVAAAVSIIGLILIVSSRLVSGEGGANESRRSA